MLGATMRAEARGPEAQACLNGVGEGPGVRVRYAVHIRVVSQYPETKGAVTWTLSRDR